MEIGAESRGMEAGLVLERVDLASHAAISLVARIASIAGSEVTRDARA